MPRVSINRELYRARDLKKLIEIKMIMYGYKQKDLARVLNISQPALSKKMTENNYSLNDFVKISEVLNFTDEELVSLLGGRK